MKVCAIVVTFNRKELLKAQLNTMAEQEFLVNDYYIIDNCSSDGTEELINELEGAYPFSVHYIKMKKNIGGAGGFSEGLKIAYNDSYDWYIMMDDDGRPFDRVCFSSIFKHISESKYKSDDLYLLNSLVTYDNVGLSFGLGHIDTVEKCLAKAQNGLYIGVVNPFNGTVISNGLISKIGFPNGDFFIKGDEVDYYRRAIASGAFIATVIESRYNHPKPEGISHRVILGKERYIYIEAPWKEYYNVRNSVFSYRSMGEPKKATIFALNRILCCFMCKCPKASTIKMIARGYKDGKKERLGALVKPGEK